MQLGLHGDRRQQVKLKLQLPVLAHAQRQQRMHTAHQREGHKQGIGMSKRRRVSVPMMLTQLPSCPPQGAAIAATSLHAPNTRAEVWHISTAAGIAAVALTLAPYPPPASPAAGRPHQLPVFVRAGHQRQQRVVVPRFEHAVAVLPQLAHPVRARQRPHLAQVCCAWRPGCTQPVPAPCSRGQHGKQAQRDGCGVLPAGVQGSQNQTGVPRLVEPARQAQAVLRLAKCTSEHRAARAD